MLLFPSAESVDLQSMDPADIAKIKRVVLVDSTWSQTRYYLREKALLSLKHVRIQTEKTVFWRYQAVADTNLATVEALYFFFRDYDIGGRCGGSKELYDGRFDNLLYFYAWNYKLI